MRALSLAAMAQAAGGEAEAVRGSAGARAESEVKTAAMCARTGAACAARVSLWRWWRGQGGLIWRRSASLMKSVQTKLKILLGNYRSLDIVPGFVLKFIFVNQAVCQD